MHTPPARTSVARVLVGLLHGADRNLDGLAGHPVYCVKKMLYYVGRLVFPGHGKDGDVAIHHHAHAF